MNFTSEELKMLESAMYYKCHSLRCVVSDVYKKKSTRAQRFRAERELNLHEDLHLKLITNNRKEPRNIE